MIQFSYSMQEQLAQRELDILSNVIQIDFNTEKKQIMKDFFTEVFINGEKERKDTIITQSPIVRLEYLKTKYPVIEKIDLDTFLLDVDKLETQRQELRRQQFTSRVNEIGIQTDSVLTLDKLFQQQDTLQQFAIASKVGQENLVESRKR